MKTLDKPKISRSVTAVKNKVCIERGKRVKLARMLVELTRKDIDERYNLSQHTIHAWEKGTNCITEKSAERLVQVFAKEGLSITKEWLLHGTDPLFTNSINLEGKNKDLQDALSIQGDIQILNEINFFRENNANSISVMITDEALLPFFFVGDYVGGINIPSNLINEFIGEFCIISTEDGQVYVRKIFSHQSNNVYIIGSINPLINIHEPTHFMCNIQAAAKISRHWRLSGNVSHR